MKTIILFLGILMITINCIAQKSQILDGALNYQINVQHELRNDLLQVVKNGNPNIVQLEMLKIQDNNFPLGISIYEGDEIKPIEEVLKDFVFNVKANDVTRNIEGKSFKKDGKTFHRKITISNMGDRQVYNVMYYFMKNNKSNILYELKLNGSITKRQLIDSTLYDIVKTVNFQ
jgi:hypothetical protein